MPRRYLPQSSLGSVPQTLEIPLFNNAVRHDAGAKLPFTESHSVGIVSPNSYKEIVKPGHQQFRECFSAAIRSYRKLSFHLASPGRGHSEYRKTVEYLAYVWYRKLIRWGAGRPEDVLYPPIVIVIP